MADIGYVIVKEIINRTEKAWLIKFDDDRELWIPKSVIHGYDPAVKRIRIETWALKRKSIKYKLK